MCGHGAFVRGDRGSRTNRSIARFHPDRQKSTAPDDAIARLKAGNERFTAGKSINCDLMAQVRQTAGNQAPFAAIVGCIDSRVPPELVFDQRIGDVFCARVAGNFVNTDIIGSLEYSTKVSGAKAIVVLGHNSCGAIKAGSISSSAASRRCSNFQPALGRLNKATMAIATRITIRWFKRSPRRTPA